MICSRIRDCSSSRIETKVCAEDMELMRALPVLAMALRDSRIAPLVKACMRAAKPEDGS